MITLEQQVLNRMDHNMEVEDMGLTHSSNSSKEAATPLEVSVLILEVMIVPWINIE